MEDEEEQKHFKQVISAFFNYSVDAMRDISRMERDYNQIDAKYQKYLSFDFKKDRIDRLKKAVLQNSLVLNQIVKEYQSLFEFDRLPNGLIAFKPMFIKPSDIVKMRSTIKSFLRDWSSEVSTTSIHIFRARKKGRCVTTPSRRRCTLISLTRLTQRRGRG